MKSPPPKKKTTATQSSEASLQSAYLPNTEVNESNYLDITIKDVKGSVGIVKLEHDELAARNLFHYFHYRLKDGGIFDDIGKLNPMERAFVDYVEYAFARVVDQGKSFDVAFGLAPGRGEHQRESTVERDVIAAAYMTLLERNDWKYEIAVDEVAKFLSQKGFFQKGKGKSAVKKAYAEFHETFSTTQEKTLMELLPDDVPPIQSCKIEASIIPITSVIKPRYDRSKHR